MSDDDDGSGSRLRVTPSGEYLLAFEPSHVDQIRQAEKTVTRREWDDDSADPSPGTVVGATTDLSVAARNVDCYVRVEAVYDQPLGDMTDADARAEGYADLEAFRTAYCEVYGDAAWDDRKVVTVVEFEYVGRERPEEHS